MSKTFRSNDRYAPTHGDIKARRRADREARRLRDLRVAAPELEPLFAALERR